MFLRSFLPSSSLKDIVVCYLLLEINGQDSGWELQPQMPAGLPGIGFMYGDATYYGSARCAPTRINSCVILGQHDLPYYRWYKGARKEFVIILKPAALYQVLKIHAAELRNRLVDASLLGIAGSRELAEELAARPDPAAKIELAESWLLRQLARNYSRQSLTQYVLERIAEKHGCMSIRELAGEMRLDRRLIERHFDAGLGLSPKRFAEIVRFNYINQLILQNPGISMQELTFRGAFCDQSHLVKHIGKITGICPSEYRDFLFTSLIIRFNHMHTVSGLKEGIQKDYTDLAGVDTGRWTAAGMRRRHLPSRTFSLEVRLTSGPEGPHPGS